MSTGSTTTIKFSDIVRFVNSNSSNKTKKIYPTVQDADNEFIPELDKGLDRDPFKDREPRWKYMSMDEFTDFVNGNNHVVNNNNINKNKNREARKPPTIPQNDEECFTPLHFTKK